MAVGTLALASFLSLPTIAQEAPACGMLRVSSETSGLPVLDACHHPEVSFDGSRVAFLSRGLPGGVFTSRENILVRDLLANTLIQASLAWDGSQPEDDCLWHSMSSDGRYVAFESRSDNLVPGDTNDVTDVFVRDTLAGVTVRASLDSAGNEGNGWSTSPFLSGDGRFVCFRSYASNLDPADPDISNDVYVRDLVAGTTRVVSVDSAGVPRTGNHGRVADGGRYAVFESSSPNVVSGDTNGGRDVFRHDLLTGETIRVSVSSSGSQIEGDSPLLDLSSDGSQLTFGSPAPGLTELPGPAGFKVYVKDLVTGEVRIASLNAAGTRTINSFAGRASDDGRFVAFATNSGEVVPGDTNGTYDLFVHDLERGTTHLASVGLGGAPGNAPSGANTAQGFDFAGNGASVTFTSSASNMAQGHTLGYRHVYQRDNGPSYRSYCFGDGDGSPCPCGNEADGDELAGCVNSRGYGARLEPRGSNCLVPDDLRFGVSRVPGSVIALLFAGERAVDGGAPFGDGLLCVDIAVRRFDVLTASVTGDAEWGPGLGAEAGWIAGDQRYLQVWYRDPIAAPCGSHFNLTNAVDLPVAP